MNRKQRRQMARLDRLPRLARPQAQTPDRFADLFAKAVQHFQAVRHCSRRWSLSAALLAIQSISAACITLALSPQIGRPEIAVDT